MEFSQNYSVEHISIPLARVLELLLKENGSFKMERSKHHTII